MWLWCFNQLSICNVKCNVVRENSCAFTMANLLYRLLSDIVQKYLLDFKSLSCCFFK